MLEIDGECKSIKFRVVDAVDQLMILEMDFGRRRQGGRWHEFVTENWGRGEATIDGKCTGLSSISDEQRSESDKLMDEALASQKDQPGLTRLIEHHICVTDERHFKHKMRRMSEVILGKARQTVEK